MLPRFPVFASAQRFFIAKASFLRTAGDMVRFFTEDSAFAIAGAFIFAQRAFAAAANFARCDAEILRFPFTGEGADAFTAGEVPKIAANSASSAAMLSAILTACVS